MGFSLVCISWGRVSMISIEDAYQMDGFLPSLYTSWESVYEIYRRCLSVNGVLPSLYTLWGRVSMKSIEDAYQWMGFSLVCIYLEGECLWNQ